MHHNFHLKYEGHVSAKISFVWVCSMLLRLLLSLQFMSSALIQICGTEKFELKVSGTKELPKRIFWKKHEEI